MKRTTRAKSHKFYVYEHWRPDKNICFWVGKGHNNRAWQFKRNTHYNRIVAKLSRLGMCIEVRMIESGLVEAEALSLEKVRIAFWRARHKHLVNMTDGGQGTVGIVYSDERRAHLAKVQKGKKMSKEAREKIRHAALNRSESYRKKLSASLKGRKLSKAHCKKLSLAQLKRPPTSAKARKNMRIAQRARGPRSLETRMKTSESIRLWHLSLGHKPGPVSIELQ